MKQARIATGLIVAAGLLAAVPAPAAPLCRDSKGLFTPCPRETNAHARAIIEKASEQPEPAVETQKPAATADFRSQRPAALAPARKPAPGMFRKAKSCRDTKGLYTPCPQ